MTHVSTEKDLKSLYSFYPFNHPGLILADAECAVLKGEPFRVDFSGHCGYCVFPKDEIPEEWHGNYNAESMGRVEAHGGITYADIGGGDDEGRIAALKSLWAEKEARYVATKAAGGEFVNLWSEYDKRGEKLKRAFAYTHVVFGFDTAHHMDDQNDALHSADYVLELAHRMRRSIVERVAEFKREAL